MTWPDAYISAVSPLGRRPACADTETALAKVVAVFGAAQPHCTYLYANRRATRMKVLVHDGIGVWLAARRLNQGIDFTGQVFNKAAKCSWIPKNFGPWRSAYLGRRRCWWCGQIAKNSVSFSSTLNPSTKLTLPKVFHFRSIAP
ncbi:IS66 family insertion sequence element accessory protein TnpB [Pseudomonas huanghezhanensis]|uniref:IS66 family insertion sequence element accessory protein TnpB n=1 Tax=Pseudomonas huanghezhanensis TaxID=3002903 RepID=UPI002285F8AC|nr:IS66 family insertion sequence element accessory protein TnpB [Pseudomonas sp. BSw22131]